tara:strand:- start:418 stop:657 length:240 start_codon:yes stop_codon:yes gene_type:complete
MIEIVDLENHLEDRVANLYTDMEWGKPAMDEGAKILRHALVEGRMKPTFSSRNLKVCLGWIDISISVSISRYISYLCVE